jgi:hypothetical protein
MTALVFAEEDRCWLCLRLVDHTLPANHRMGRTVDHLVQLDHLDEDTQWLALDRSNLRLAHRACNSARGNRLRLIPINRCACRAGMACGPLTRPGGGPVVSFSVPIDEI